MKKNQKPFESFLVIIAFHNSISLTVFSHSAFNVLKFRFRDPFISSPLRLSQFVRGLGARGVTYNFIYTCRLRKLIILTTLSDM